MIKNKQQISVSTERNNNGEIKLYLYDLADFPKKNSKLETFAHAVLKKGEEVEFHIHEGESESYYILSGNGVYNDNGTAVDVTKGTVTFTPSGCGHGIKNISDENLEFIALIIAD